MSTFAGNSALSPSDVIDFAVLLAQRIWRETVLLFYFILLMSCDLEVTNESARFWEKTSSSITVFFFRRCE